MAMTRCAASHKVTRSVVLSLIALSPSTFSRRRAGHVVPVSAEAAQCPQGAVAKRSPERSGGWSLQIATGGNGADGADLGSEFPARPLGLKGSAAERRIQRPKAG